MSVYTSISDIEFSEILENYTLGDFVSAQGIKAGIENTNYFVTTTTAEFVFTIFEKINQQQLDFYISLLQKLSAKGIACPKPQPDKNNQAINIIKSKPFTFVSKLKGKNLTSVNHKQCYAIAIELAKLHRITSSISENQHLQNRRGKIWRDKTAKKLLAKLPVDEANLLSSELNYYQQFDDTKLPKGIIHADLFKDNALFENNQLTGIIDFYDACYDNYLYDIAITINAWCTDGSGKLKEDLTNSFLQAYQSVRVLTDTEKQAWPIMLRMAAMRFWLSRLDDGFMQNTQTTQQGTLTHSKNPQEYKLILQNHVKSEFSPFFSG